ncbi:hypothetical protein ACFL08_01315 [Patescibacteria group bacterium]
MRDDHVTENSKLENIDELLALKRVIDNFQTLEDLGIHLDLRNPLSRSSAMKIIIKKLAEQRFHINT